MLNQIDTSQLGSYILYSGTAICILSVVTIMFIRIVLLNQIKHENITNAGILTFFISGIIILGIGVMIKQNQSNANQQAMQRIQHQTDTNIKRLNDKIQAENANIKIKQNQINGYTIANNQPKIIKLSQQINQHQKTINQYKTDIQNQKQLVIKAKQLTISMQ